MSLKAPASASASSSVSRASAAVAAAPAAAAKAAPQRSVAFKVLSYNVNFGSCYDDVMKCGDNTNAPHVLRAIAESGADIVCLQETHTGWELAVRAHPQLARVYPHQSWHHPDGGYYASGLGVLWKAEHKLLHQSLYQPKVEGSFFPGQRVAFSLFHGKLPAPAAAAATADAKAKPVAAALPAAGGAAAPAAVPGAVDVKADAADALSTDTKTPAAAGAAAGAAAAGAGAGASAAAGLSTHLAAAGAGGAVVDIVNVHLRPPLPMGNGSLASWGTVKAYLWETTAVRMQELAAFVSQPGYAKPTIVCGDCNEGDTGSAVSWMLGHGYADALAVANTRTTWYWPLFWRVELFGSYDHVFYAPDAGLHCTQCTVMEAYKNASDHLPVAAAFTLKF